MRWRKHPDPEELFGALEAPRPMHRHTLGFIGLLPDSILETCRLFAEGEVDALMAALRDQGQMWAMKTLEDLWGKDQEKARHQALFDLMWHHRALEIDPFVTAADFAGFDVLLDACREVDPSLGDLLSCLNGNDPDNPRRSEGPEWWRAWHRATGSTSGGWLELDEVKVLASGWGDLARPEIEEACLESMGATYTHPGCWTLLEQLGGFFAQCASENRSVTVEVDL